MKLRSSYRKTLDIIPEVVRLRAEGYTLDDIGKRFNLSRQRINQIEQAAQKHEEILRVWGFPFSTRTFNILESLAIKSRQEALDLYNLGHLQPRSVRGFGWVSYREICEWLGVPTVRQPLTKTVCPHCGKQI